MIFYYAPKSVALACHIALEESSISYDARIIDFNTNQQRSSDYLSINPKGRVPALVGAEGVLTETPAMLAFIAQSDPQSKLAPIDEPFLFAKCQEFNLYLCSTVHVAHARRVRGTRWTDDKDAIETMKKKVPDNMKECLNLIQSELFAGPWVLGEEYSICDPYLFTICQWLKGDGLSLKDYPTLLEFEKRMRDRPAVSTLAELYGL